MRSVTPLPLGSKVDGSSPVGLVTSAMIFPAWPAPRPDVASASIASSGVLPPAVLVPNTAARASAVLHVFEVCAADARAKTASAVSKPGNPATSKPPSACCWVLSQPAALVTAVDDVARGDRREDEEG